MEDLEARYRLLDQECRHLQVQEEERLRQVIEAYNIGQESGQKDIKEKEEDVKKKELALNKSKEALRTAIQTAEQSEATRKRKHEAEVQVLKEKISNLKRLKRSSMELQVDAPHPSVSSSLALNSGLRTLEKPRFDGTPEAQTGAPRMAEPAHISKDDFATHASSQVQSFPGSDFHGSSAASRLEPFSKSKQQDPGFAGRQYSTVAKPLHVEKPDEARAKSTGGNDPSEPQPHEHSGQDELYNSSCAEEPLDDDFTAEEEELISRGDVSSQQAQSRALPLTKKTIAYKEVYDLARDPGAEHKHWIVEYPKRRGNWYIVRCMDHGLNWGKNPVRAATKHLLGKSHACSSKPNLAIEELGELVEDCDRQKADASNAEYQKALDQNYEPNNIMTKPAQESRHEPSKGIIHPVVGEVYYAWWDFHPSGWYLVVVLPYLGDGDWKEVGITGNLFNSGLRDNIPECFNVLQDSKKEERLAWAEGYEDDGPKVSARKFPCLFLHRPLKIPTADQEFTLGDTAEVLAFRTAQQLRHRSTILPPGLSIMVDAFQGLARDFETRLRAIQAKQNPASEQGVEDNVQASLLQDQQYPKATDCVESMQYPHPSSTSGVQDPRHYVTASDLSRPEDRYGESSDPHELAPRNPRQPEPRFDRNNSDTPTTRTAYRLSPNGEEGGQAASRQAQPMVSKSQNQNSSLTSQSSATSRTGEYSSQSPRAAASSDRDFHPLTTGGHGPIQGMADLSNISRGKLSDISRPLPGSRGRFQESGLTSQSFGRSWQDASVPVPSRDSQGLRASTPAGPSALRPLDRKENASYSEELPEQDRMSRRGRSTDAVERDGVPNGAGKTTWPSSYSATLRQPWRDSEKGSRRSENQ